MSDKTPRKANMRDIKLKLLQTGKDGEYIDSPEANDTKWVDGVDTSAESDNPPGTTDGLIDSADIPALEAPTTFTGDIEFFGVDLTLGVPFIPIPSFTIPTTGRYSFNMFIAITNSLSETKYAKQINETISIPASADTPEVTTFSGINFIESDLTVLTDYTFNFKKNGTIIRTQRIIEKQSALFFEVVELVGGIDILELEIIPNIAPPLGVNIRETIFGHVLR